jgi:hypothetical protein
VLLSLLTLLQQATCAPCVKQQPQSLIVSTTRQAAQLAAAVDCEGGTFSVAWFGNVTVNTTIAVGTGTALTITAPAAAATTAVANGANTAQLFSVAAAGMLSLEGLTLSTALSMMSAAAIYASEGSTVSLTSCEVSDCQGALGAIALERKCTLSLTNCKVLRNRAIPRTGMHHLAVSRAG